MGELATKRAKIIQGLPFFSGGDLEECLFGFGSVIGYQKDRRLGYDYISYISLEKSYQNGPKKYLWIFGVTEISSLSTIASWGQGCLLGNPVSIKVVGLSCITPQKTSIELEKYPLGKGETFSKHHFLGYIHVSFQGVWWIFYVHEQPVGLWLRFRSRNLGTARCGLCATLLSASGLWNLRVGSCWSNQICLAGP